MRSKVRDFGGFLQYCIFLGLQVLFPDWNVGEILYSEKLRGVLVTDSLKASHPISKLDVETTDEIIELFDDISYRKGSSLIRMIVSFMGGRQVFFKALSRYLKAFAYGNAAQDDLWHYLSSDNAGILPKNVTLKEIMDSWTLQTGYPVVSVSKGSSGVQFTQKRFLLASEDDCGKPSWWVPISYVVGSAKNGKIPDWTVTLPKGWLSPTNFLTLPPVKEDEWVVVNVGHAGYYRVNYEEENWRKLAAQLRANHSAIDVVNRAQIIDDVLSLAQAGLVTYSTVLDVLSYLPNERDYLPLAAASSHFRFMLDMTSDDERVAKYVLNLITPALDQIVFNGGEETVDKETKAYKNLERIWYNGLLLKWGSKLGHAKTREEARRHFNKWMETYDPENPDAPSDIRPDSKEAVKCLRTPAKNCLNHKLQIIKGPL
jgi:aminopeptidase N